MIVSNIAKFSLQIQIMAKFSPNRKLTQEQRQQALLELCHALVMVQKLDEAAKFLGDLLSDQEIEMIAKRLQIAKLLLKNKTYDEIRDTLKVSDTTVARVNGWLQQAGEGFRMVMKRGLQKEDMKIPSWIPSVQKSEMARRFPLYYWPQGLLENIMRAANNRQRKEMLTTLQTFNASRKGKRELFRHLEILLLESGKNPRARQQLEKKMQRN